MIEPVKAIKLSWQQVSDCISQEVSNILGSKFICKARSSDYCYWGIVFMNKEITLDELYKIFVAVTANESERQESLPELAVKKSTLLEIGMRVGELLLERHFNCRYETTHIEENSLWLLGIKDGESNGTKD